jgi:hypothetical protein
VRAYIPFSQESRGQVNSGTERARSTTEMDKDIYEVLRRKEQLVREKQMEHQQLDKDI